jgi:hypothetical protein
MSGVSEKIKTVDYNSVQADIAELIGTGDGSFGWGQLFSSSPVTDLSRITVNEWGNLRNDIRSAHQHIFGSLPSVVEAELGNLVRYNNTGTTPQQATQPVEQYSRWVNQLRQESNRFTVAAGRFMTVNKGNQSRTFNGPLGQTPPGDVWSNQLECTVTVSFTTANAARNFFNSGGEVRLVSSRTGGSSNPQNNAWTNLLNSAGTRIFGAQIPSTGFSPLNGTNFYKLTTSYQEWYSVSSSFPYAANKYSISARRNATSTQVHFLVEWIDAYVDLQPSLPNDEVDGTITIATTTKEATGPLIPAVLGTFTVESPTVSYSNITGT